MLEIRSTLPRSTWIQDGGPVPALHTVSGSPSIAWPGVPSAVEDEAVACLPRARFVEPPGSDPSAR
jgi:hypothetical protein